MENKAKAKRGKVTYDLSEVSTGDYEFLILAYFVCWTSKQTQIYESLNPRLFSNLGIGYLLNLAFEIYKKGEEVSLMALKVAIEKNIEKIEITFPASFIAKLFAHAPATDVGIDQIIKSIQTQSMKNLVKRLDDKINTDVIEDPEELSFIINKELSDIVSSYEKNKPAPVSDFNKEETNLLHLQIENPEKYMGVKTYWDPLDYIIRGLVTGVITIASRPSMGKTAFGLSLADNVANKSNNKVMFCSCEMPISQLVRRLWAAKAKVPVDLVVHSILNGLQLKQVTGAQAFYHNVKNLIFFDGGGLSFPVLKNKILSYFKENPFQLLVIDYLQLIGMGKKVESRQLEVTEVTQGFRHLAKLLKIPIVLLSQLSREVEKRKDHFPQLSDLRESGSIEQESDMVGFLYREGYYTEDPYDTSLQVLIKKHRNGSLGTATLKFVKEYALVTDFEP